MIEAGIATELRLAEWQGAWMAEDVLHVPHSKFRDGVSGSGKPRELTLIA